jgi:preprotein translocase subunit SecG
MNFGVFASWLPVVQLALSVVLATCVLLQSRGASVGATFGGTGTIYRTKRGVEKLLFRSTVVVGTLFAAVSLARVLA